MKLEINFKKKNGKFTNMWILNNILLNSQLVKEIKREIKKYPERNENRNSIYQNMQGAWQSNSKTKVDRHKCLHQGKKDKRFQVNSLTLNFEEPY